MEEKIFLISKNESYLRSFKHELNKRLNYGEWNIQDKKNFKRKKCLVYNIKNPKELIKYFDEKQDIICFLDIENKYNFLYSAILNYSQFLKNEKILGIKDR